jgi:hypothetical protein
MQLLCTIISSTFYVRLHRTVLMLWNVHFGSVSLKPNSLKNRIGPKRETGTPMPTLPHARRCFAIGNTSLLVICTLTALPMALCGSASLVVPSPSPSELARRVATWQKKLHAWAWRRTCKYLPEPELRRQQKQHCSNQANQQERRERRHGRPLSSDQIPPTPTPTPHPCRLPVLRCQLEPFHRPASAKPTPTGDTLFLHDLQDCISEI